MEQLVIKYRTVLWLTDLLANKRWVVSVQLRCGSDYLSWLCFQQISPYNTRLFKTQDESGEIVYEVRLASAATDGEPAPDLIKCFLF